MPTWPVHLAIANKLKNRYHYTEDFIIGNILPDTMNGFMVPNTSNIYHHTITHYSKVEPLGPPKISIIDFLNDNRKKLNNELILGTYTHLLADFYFNEYTMEHHIKEEDGKLKGILNDGTVEKDLPPMPIKQQDFKVFGDYLIKNNEVEEKISITKNTLELSKALNYKIEKEDIEKTILVANQMIETKPQEEKYKMFTLKELMDLYNSCYEYIDNALNNIREEKEISKVFENYTSKYDINDKDISYKYYHSYRVMEFAKYIANKKNLSTIDKKLSTIIGLYHDIGRFEQDRLFNSYTDTEQFDHADYGEELLINKELIKQIPIEESYYKLIAKSVKNHNKYKIEEGLNEQELFHAKLIRDADKLDILYYMSERKFISQSFDYENSTFDIRDSIKEEFFNKQQIYIKDKPNKTNSEKAVIILALTFDLNFKETAEYILENHILENIYNVLPNKENYKEYIALANKHLKELVKC